jgi:hypothetical protein
MQNHSEIRSADPRFGHSQYSIKRKLLQAFGATLYLYDSNEQVVLWGQQKAFKLKEDLRFFADENKSQELIRIAARSIMDFSAAYDVFDSQTGQKIGAFKRKGWKSSLMQDSWLLMDAQDRELGQVQEDSALLGLLRRYVDYVSLLFPQKFTVSMTVEAANRVAPSPIAAPNSDTPGMVDVAHYKQTKNPFSSKMEIDFAADSQNLFDRRLGLALAMLLVVVEGKQR